MDVFQPLQAALLCAQTYADFSTEARLDGAKRGRNILNPTNLEAIHDHVHVLVGGHMGIVSQAALILISWLHHTNVDRILAIYQAAFPNECLKSVEAVSSVWYASGTITDGNTSLSPFRSHAKSGFWTCTALRPMQALSRETDDKGSLVPIRNETQLTEYENEPQCKRILSPGRRHVSDVQPPL